MNSVNGIEGYLTEFRVSYEVNRKFLFPQVSELVLDQLNVLPSVTIGFELHAALLNVEGIPGHVVFTQKLDVINPRKIYWVVLSVIEIGFFIVCDRRQGEVTKPDYSGNNVVVSAGDLI